MSLAEIAGLVLENLVKTKPPYGEENDGTSYNTLNDTIWLGRIETFPLDKKTVASGNPCGRTKYLLPSFAELFGTDFFVQNVHSSERALSVLLQRFVRRFSCQESSIRVTNIGYDQEVTVRFTFTEWNLRMFG